MIKKVRYTPCEKFASFHGGKEKMTICSNQQKERENDSIPSRQKIDQFKDKNRKKKKKKKGSYPHIFIVVDFFFCNPCKKF